MKTLKYFLSAFLVIAVVFSCSEDELNNIDFTKNAVAPSNVNVKFEVTQDNTGAVTMFPSAEAATSFDIDFGDSNSPAEGVKPGKSVSHTYAEGTYTVNITAIGITGLATEFSKDLDVSFQAPTFGTDPIIENDGAISKQVNVTVPDDTQFAVSFDVYFVEDGLETIISGNVGETVSYIYANPGIVDIKVVLKGAAIATTEYIVTDFEVTEILTPVESAPTPPGRYEADYYSIFSDAYTNIDGSDFNPWWWQATTYTMFDLNGDSMLQYSNLNYQGIQIGETIDVSSMEYLHVDVWTPKDLASVDIYPLPVGVAPEDEKFKTLELVEGGWTSFDIPLSYFTDQGLSLDQIHQFKFVGENSGTIFVDNLYFWKEPSAPSPLIGTWMMAPEAGAFAVGEAVGNYGWWSSSDQDVIDRACIFDDEYVFEADGTFKNVLGSETWLEGWQGNDGESCGVPIAPHDGTNPATWSSTASSVTVSGLGAYLGLSKVHAGGEDGMPENNTITYDYELSNDGNSMTLTIAIPWGAWQFKMVRKPSPIVGTWKLAPQAGALEVGEAVGNYGWWSNSEGDVTERACLFDDKYVFNADGSFSNVMDGETWLEGWQGNDGESCGVPVAPHDGSNAATWSSTGNTLTVNGLGAFLGLAKVHAGGEDGMPADNMITYTYELSDNDTTMDLVIQIPWGAWHFKLVKQ